MTFLLSPLLGDMGKQAQSRHQDPINFTVTFGGPQSQPWLQEAHSRESPDQTGGPGLFSWPPTQRGGPSSDNLNPAGLCLRRHVTCGGRSLECLVGGNENQSARPWIADNICKCIFCHHSVPLPLKHRLTWKPANRTLLTMAFGNGQDISYLGNPVFFRFCSI